MDWLLASEYLDQNPVANIQRVSSRKHQEDSPRALTREEVESLLAVSEERRTVYLTAVMTGIRRGELRQLRVSDIKLDCEFPHIVVRSTVSKNGKQRCQPLHGDLAAVLKEQIKGRSPAENALELPTWKTFQRDLKRAGIAKRNAEGRKVSFHSFRHTFCTTAHIHGIEPRTIQELMGHSDLKLTIKTYTDTALLPTASAINKLPSYIQPPQKSPQPPQIAPQKSGSEGLKVTQTGKEALALEIAKLLDSKEFCHALAQIGAEGKWWAIQNSNL